MPRSCAKQDCAASAAPRTRPRHLPSNHNRPNNPPMPLLAYLLSNPCFLLTHVFPSLAATRRLNDPSLLHAVS